MERLLKVKDICELYGLTKYEARTVMSRVKRINIGRSDTNPRWATTAKQVEEYFLRMTSGTAVPGLDRHGKIIRR